MAGRAAFEIHREFVTNVILPNFVLVNVLVYFAELGFATALILGLFVRLAGVAAALFTVNLWLGIYNQRPGDPVRMAVELRVPDFPLRQFRGVRGGTGARRRRVAPRASAIPALGRGARRPRAPHHLTGAGARSLQSEKRSRSS